MAKLPRPNSTVLEISLVVGIVAVFFGGLYLASRGLLLLDISSEVARDQYGIKVDSLAPKGTRVLDVIKARSFLALRGKCSPEIADEWMKDQIQGEEMISVDPANGGWGLLRFAPGEPDLEFTTFYKTDPKLYSVKGIRRFKYVGYDEPSQTWFWLEGYK